MFAFSLSVSKKKKEMTVPQVALEKAQRQAAVPPVDHQIKAKDFIGRAKKRLLQHDVDIKPKNFQHLRVVGAGVGDRCPGLGTATQTLTDQCRPRGGLVQSHRLTHLRTKRFCLPSMAGV